MSQIIQEDRDHLTVKIVRAAGFRDEQGETLVRGLQERVGEEMRIRLEFVDEIPRSLSGKILRRVLMDRDRQAAGSPPS